MSALHNPSHAHKRTHSLHSHATPSDTPLPKKKKFFLNKVKREKRQKKTENRKPETNRKHFDHEFGRSIIANIQEANYKNCQYHFPLNSHNRKQPLLIWGKTCFLIKLEKKQTKRFPSTLETTGINNFKLYKLHVQLQMCNNNIVMIIIIIIDFT